MSDYDAKVKQQAERLSSWSYGEIEAAVTAKRIAWLREHALDSSSAGSVTPRVAFERLFLEYMGLSRADLPVIEETASKITWLSKNPCPTLDACQQLGLETREVCRAISEKPTQAFLSWLDPQLRFIRSYQEIRPYAAHCLESIVRIDDPWFIRSAV
jgi:hypothetical protein